MKFVNLSAQFAHHPAVETLHKHLEQNQLHVQLTGISGSGIAFVIAGIFEHSGKQQHVFVVPDKEQAAYFYNDLERLLSDSDTDYNL
ncbi:MAG: hypothetical protein COW63_10745, partial [Bacteroidetes bacterium CG18_big_fil_WC_8_21_14_2_50_41_14]